MTHSNMVGRTPLFFAFAGKVEFINISTKTTLYEFVFMLAKHFSRREAILNK
jgi:hypothetical protein